MFFSFFLPLRKYFSTFFIIYSTINPQFNEFFPFPQTIAKKKIFAQVFDICMINWRNLPMPNSKFGFESWEDEQTLCVHLMSVIHRMKLVLYDYTLFTCRNFVGGCCCLLLLLLRLELCYFSFARNFRKYWHFEWIHMDIFRWAWY